MPTKTKPSKKIVSKKVKAVVKPPATPTPVAAPTPEPVKVQVKQTSAEVTDSLFNDLQAQLTKLNDAGVQLPSLKKGLIALKKSMDRERKDAAKALPKKRIKNTSSAPRAPSGFAKPAAISKELAKFIGETPDALVARTTVTRFITNYVKEKDLQNPKNKRHILPDASLKKLLAVSDKDEVTYFNLQKHLKKHYPPAKKAVSA